MSHLNALVWLFHIAFAEIASLANSARRKLRYPHANESLAADSQGKSLWDIEMILKISELTLLIFRSRTQRENSERRAAPSLAPGYTSQRHRTAGTTRSIYVDLEPLPCGTGAGRCLCAI
jgi:hypothetical protein